MVKVGEKISSFIINFMFGRILRCISRKIEGRKILVTFQKGLLKYCDSEGYHDTSISGMISMFLKDKENRNYIFSILEATVFKSSQLFVILVERFKTFSHQTFETDFNYSDCIYSALNTCTIYDSETKKVAREIVEHFDENSKYVGCSGYVESIKRTDLKKKTLSSTIMFHNIKNTWTLIAIICHFLSSLRNIKEFLFQGCLALGKQHLFLTI